MFRNSFYSLALEALNDLLAESQSSQKPSEPGETEMPLSAPVWFDPTTWPADSLFFGVAEDGLPVLLDLHNPLPGPILVCADDGAGKTQFLQTVASSIARLHPADAVQFGVVTTTPEEWTDWENLEHSLGVYSPLTPEAADFLPGLRSWVQHNRNRQLVVLLWDDLTTVALLEPQVQAGVRWMFLRGPTHHLWPIVSVKPYLEPSFLPWLTFFHTRLFGRIEHPEISALAPRSARAWLPELKAGIQFALLEGAHWLRFWLPSLRELLSSEGSPEGDDE